MISAIFAGLVSAFAWLIGLSWWALGLAAFILVAALAIFNEHLVRRLYHAWNNRIIRPLSNIASTILLRICLLIIFAATGRAGSRLELTSRSGTMWAGRDSGVNRTSILPFAGVGPTAGVPNGWIRNYLRWAIQSQNAWAVFLIPFFWMLRMVSTEEPTSSGANIYTLF